MNFDEIIFKPCDVWDTQKMQKEGIANFWLRAIRNHPTISQHISKRDEPIIALLINLECILHRDNSVGFDLKFTFDKKAS